MFAVHPGRIMDTGLSRHLSTAEVQAVPRSGDQGRAFTSAADYVKSVEQGAATTVWCATSRQLDGRGGVYCEDCDIAPIAPIEAENEPAAAGSGVPHAMVSGTGVRPYAVDPSSAARLWTFSEKLTGIVVGYPPVV